MGNKRLGSSEKMRKTDLTGGLEIGNFDQAVRPAVGKVQMIQLPTFSYVQQSDFWKFFNIRILRQLKEEDLIYYRLQTSAFQNEVDLMLVVDDTERMTAGFLGLNRSWVSGPPNGFNPFALDIARSFITLAIGGQGPASENFIRLFQDAFLAGYISKVQEYASSSATHILELDAYLGAVPEVMRRFPGCDIRLKNAVTGEREFLQVIISATP